MIIIATYQIIHIILLCNCTKVIRFICNNAQYFLCTALFAPPTPSLLSLSAFSYFPKSDLLISENYFQEQELCIQLLLITQGTSVSLHKSHYRAGRNIYEYLKEVIKLMECLLIQIKLSSFVNTV
jgi:hypothetical protein